MPPAAASPIDRDDVGRLLTDLGDEATFGVHGLAYLLARIAQAGSTGSSLTR